MSDVQGVRKFADLDDSLDLGKHLPYLLTRSGMNYSLILKLSNWMFLINDSGMLPTFRLSKLSNLEPFYKDHEARFTALNIFLLL